MHQVGFADKPPSWTIYGMADVYTGMVTAYGVMQALYMRTQTGRGQFVDSAMFDNMLSLNEAMVPLYSIAGQSPSRVRRKTYSRVAHSNVKTVILRLMFRTISSGNACARRWAGMIWLMMNAARAELSVPRMPPSYSRSLKLGSPPLPETKLLTPSTKSGCPSDRLTQPKTSLPILTFGQRFTHGHQRPAVGTHTFARSPVFLSEAPDLPKEAPPALGQHTKHVLKDLGYDDEKIRELVAGDVVALRNLIS